MDSLPRSPTLFISFLTNYIMFNHEPCIDRIQKVTVADHWNQMIRIVMNPKLPFPGVNVLKKTNKSKLSFALQRALQREWINKSLTKQTTDDHRQKMEFLAFLIK